MNLEFFREFKDPYIQNEQGKGIFLAGVVLGYIAKSQVGSEKDIKNAPLFKQIQFGRMDMKNLKKQLARVPQLLAAYSDKRGEISIVAPHLVSVLSAEAGKMILSGTGAELGTEGNFAFTVGFVNANNYFWRVFRKESEDE